MREPQPSPVPRRPPIRSVADVAPSRWGRARSVGTGLGAPFGQFFADRGTHLAAMIAYFALLSLIPLLFLVLALLGFTGRASESSYLVTELKKTFPEASITDIVRVVRTVQENAATLGIIGGSFILWSSLSLFSVLESACNIVYRRPNRSFIRGKVLAFGLMVGSLLTLFVSLVVGSVGFDVLRRFAPGFIGNAYVAYTVSVLLSSVAMFAFLVSVYYLLTNEDMSVREVLPGAIVATIALEATFQVLPIFLRISGNIIAVQVFRGAALLLVWLYVMANLIVFGAEVNWWRSRRGLQPADEPAGLS